MTIRTTILWDAARHVVERGSSKRKRHESSSSSDGESKRRDEWLERLERLVESMGRPPPPRSSSIQKGDELMIPSFDPSRDILTVEKWIEHVDDLAEQYDWDGRAIMRLIPGRLKGHARL